MFSTSQSVWVSVLMLQVNLAPSLEEAVWMNGLLVIHPCNVSVHKALRCTQEHTNASPLPSVGQQIISLTALPLDKKPSHTHQHLAFISNGNGTVSINSRVKWPCSRHGHLSSFIGCSSDWQWCKTWHQSGHARFRPFFWYDAMMCTEVPDYASLFKQHSNIVQSAVSLR